MSPKRMLSLVLVLFAASAASAAEVSVYPGARLEKDEMRSVENTQGKLTAKVRALMGKVQIYTTEDGFEKVYAYYQKRYPETDPGMKQTKVKIATGQTVSSAFFCLDGAKSINESRRFLKIEGPRPAMLMHAQGKAGVKIPERTLIRFTERK
jgi:hypothetical protein